MNRGRVYEFMRGLKNPRRTVAHIRCVYDNLGDIMVAEAIQEMFSELSMVSADASRLIRLCDRMIGIRRIFGYSCLGGGTLIFSPRKVGWLESLQFFTKRTIPLCTVGTGVIDPSFRKHIAKINRGMPGIRTETIQAWIECLARFKFVSVRGVESLRILQEYGLDNVEVIGDPALYYCRPSITPKSHSKRIGLTISSSSDFWNNSQALVVREFKEVIRQLGQDGWTITLFPCTAEDRSLSNQLIAESKQNMRLCDAYLRPKAFLNYVEQQDLFVGTRLHSVIGAFCTYTPALMVGYQPKCFDFMKTLGFEHNYIRSDRIQAPDIVSRIHTLYADIERLQQIQFQTGQFYKAQLISFCERALYATGCSPHQRHVS